MAIMEGGGGATVQRASTTKVAPSTRIRRPSPREAPTMDELRAALLRAPKSGMTTGAVLPANTIGTTSDPYSRTLPWKKPATTVTQPSASVSGGGGGGGFTGGAAPTPNYAAPTPSQTEQVPGPLAQPSPTQGPGVGALRDLSGQELEAALAAIESQYGLTREQLLADQSELGSTYRFLFSNLERQRQAATQGVTGDALQRGILRSGIHQGNVADVEQQFAEQTAQAEAAKQSRLFQINQALAALGPQQALAQAQAASQISGGQLALEQQLAALGQLANR